MGFRVKGVTEASFTSDVVVACLFQHSWKGLAGLSPSAFSEGGRKLGEPQNRPQGAGLRGGQDLKRRFNWTPAGPTMIPMSGDHLRLWEL